jgi:UDP-3-O-[3-hydroxymyristoyl] glucosamine N-acyltransferase
MPAEYRLADLAAPLGGELIGDGEVAIRAVASLHSARSGDLAFLSEARHRAALDATGASAVIVAPADRDATTLPRIVCADPYLGFARASALLRPPERVVAGIHPQAVVDAAARVAPSARIDAAAVVDAGAAIGERAWIGAGCWLGPGVHIGAGTRLYAGVRIYGGCELGERVIVHCGAVIGADGFGFANDRGAWVKIPQIGRVRIGNDVEIGANTAIDRGALDDTVIEDGVKLDNLVQIGHNCRIGAHTAVAGCAGIAGSTTIGRHCMIGGAAMIVGHIGIADRVVVAGGSGVRKSITEPGAYVSGFPAVPDREWRRQVALVHGLDRMNDRLRRLERGHAAGESDD